MTLYQFRLLSPRAQLIATLTEGTYLAQRDENGGGINLYHLANTGRGFFVEVGLDEAQGCFVVLRSFGSSVPLEDYTMSVVLPRFISREW